MTSKFFHLFLIGCVFTSFYVNVELEATYQTNFSQTDGFMTGPLDEQQGWSVEMGTAFIEEVAGNRRVVLLSDSPRPRISRDFSEFNEADVVFIQFMLLGGAGEPPSAAPEAFSPNAFHVALVADEGAGQIYVFDGDGIDGGSWRKILPRFDLDQNGDLLSELEITIRIDYIRKNFDVYLNGSLAGINYGFLDNIQKKFQRFELSGNPQRNTLLTEFYIGVDNPLFENDSGDGLPDDWKQLYGLRIDFDQRDMDPDQDGLTNLEEYLLGTNPTSVDTSQDGLSDSEAIDLGVDPLQPSNIFAIGLPFYDSFENWPLGNIHGRGGWQANNHFGYGLSSVTNSTKAADGERVLQVNAAEGSLTTEIDIDAESTNVIWTDLFIDPTLHMRSVPPKISSDTTVAFYFDQNGDITVWDGLENDWLSFVSRTVPNKIGWDRVTIRQDYINQTWSFWLNSVLVAENLGFASTQSSLNQFRIHQAESQARLDGVYIGHQEPEGLVSSDGLLWMTGFEQEEGFLL